MLEGRGLLFQEQIQRLVKKSPYSGSLISGDGHGLTVLGVSQEQLQSPSKCIISGYPLLTASVIQEAVSVSKLRAIGKVREAWRAAVHGVPEWATTQQLSGNNAASECCFSGTHSLPSASLLGTLRSAGAALRGRHHKRSAPRGRWLTQSRHFPISGH